MKRLNVKLPDELHARLRVAVALEQTDISNVVRSFLQEYVEKIEKKHKKR
jgi:metal-responsive CopG/Arc/MetJ family transcriptional regulator